VASGEFTHTTTFFAGLNDELGRQLALDIVVSAGNVHTAPWEDPATRSPPTGLTPQRSINTMTDITRVQERLDAELAGVADADLVHAIRRLLVTPRCEFREWDYGAPGQTFPCWIVLEHPASNTCIAFCDQGFGPLSPWGLLFLKGTNLSMGMDSCWYSHLEDAFRESMAWDGDNPAGFEIR